MIDSNTLSLLLIEKHHNGVCNRNLCLIQESMRLDDMFRTKYKRICAYLPNIAILANGDMPGKVQIIFGHVAV